MKTGLVLITAASLLALGAPAAGAQTPDCANQKTGRTVVGALLGAVAGGIIGSNLGERGDRGDGTAIGAGVGAVAGGVVGNSTADCANRPPPGEYGYEDGGPPPPPGEYESYPPPPPPPYDSADAAPGYGDQYDGSRAYGPPAYDPNQSYDPQGAYGQDGGPPPPVDDRYYQPPPDAR
ncbi:MAG: YMGG-like glycine zipper-containing protein [Caulobacteraceae bacterium]